MSPIFYGLWDNATFGRSHMKNLLLLFAASAVAGTLDAYQWSLLTAAHTNRHVQQIQEVKASAGFQAK